MKLHRHISKIIAHSNIKLNVFIYILDNYVKLLSLLTWHYLLNSSSFPHQYARIASGKALSSLHKSFWQEELLQAPAKK